jgi:general secretion pathway protein G
LCFLFVAVLAAHLLTDPEASRLTNARRDLHEIRTALETVKRDQGRYPAPDIGLSALHGIAHNPEHRERSIDGGLLDPWGNEYKYDFPGRIKNHGYDLWSDGPDGKTDKSVGGGDDIRFGSSVPIARSSLSAMAGRAKTVLIEGFLITGILYVCMEILGFLRIHWSLRRAHSLIDQNLCVNSRSEDKL